MTIDGYFLFKDRIKSFVDEYLEKNKNITSEDVKLMFGYNFVILYGLIMYENHEELVKVEE